MRVMLGDVYQSHRMDQTYAGMLTTVMLQKQTGRTDIRRLIA